MIPLHLRCHLELLEKRANSLRSGKRKTAVIDFDKTLVIGDVGEAVFLQLLNDGHWLRCDWQEYRSLCRVDVNAAYRLIVSAMKGVRVPDLEKSTMRVLERPASFIRHGRAAAAVPHPHPVMQQVVSWLTDHDYEVFVISASNQISVRLAVKNHFHIPVEHVFGIEPRVVNGVLSGELVEPVPIHAGKVETYRKHVGINAPLFSASDSLLDSPMLALTDPVGLSVWVGKNRSEFYAARELLGQSQKFCFLKRPSDYNFKKRVRVFGEQRRIVDVSLNVSAKA